MQLATKLGELIKVLQAVLNDLRAACEEIVHGAGRAKRSVEGSRRSLKAALAAHREACRQGADAVTSHFKLYMWCDWMCPSLMPLQTCLSYPNLVEVSLELLCLCLTVKIASPLLRACLPRKQSPAPALLFAGPLTK